MSDSTDSRRFYLAPGARGGSSRLELPGAHALPPPDERLVEPESNQEMIDGQLINILEATPAEPPHADRQFDVVYVLRAYVADGYVGSTELLTRVSKDSDFATDACIRKQGLDDKGHRHLEELSFEVKHTQSESSIRKRARYLLRRGVRRIFAIWVTVTQRGSAQEHVQAGPVKEWSTELDDWLVLTEEQFIEDHCLRRPLQVKALLQAVEADNAVVRALIDKNNEVIQQLKQQNYDQGKSDGYDRGKSDGYDEGQAASLEIARQAIRLCCSALGIELSQRQQAELKQLHADALKARLQYIQSHRRWPSV